MQVHRSHGIDVRVPDASLPQLQGYLAQPGRPLKALLNRKKVAVSYTHLTLPTSDLV